MSDNNDESIVKEGPDSSEDVCNCKCSSKCMLLTIFIVIATAVLVGGGVYYYMSSKTTDVTPVATKTDTTTVKDNTIKTEAEVTKTDDTKKK